MSNANATHRATSDRIPRLRPVRFALAGLAILVAVVAAVLAWPSSQPSAGTATLAAAQLPTVRTCAVVLRPEPGVGGVRVHRSPSASSYADGVLYPGHTIREAWGPAGNCWPVAGGQYTACGQSSRFWQPVAWGGRTDYVALFCVIPAG